MSRQHCHSINSSLVYANSGTTAGLVSKCSDGTDSYAGTCFCMREALQHSKDQTFFFFFLLNSKLHKMKNKMSVLIPAITARWGRRKISIIIKTNPSHLASCPCNSSPVTA